MLSVEDRYYKLNRILLRVVGLWPYQNSKWTRIQLIITSSIYLSAIFVQLAVFITHECTWDITIDVLSTIFSSIFSFYIYDIYYFNSDMMKEITERMYYDWMSLERKTELVIMDNYASTTKMLTEIFVYFVFTGIFGVIVMQVIPITLDVVSPLNENRVHLYIAVEYFIDPIKYNYLFVFHFGIFICLALMTIAAVGMALFSYCFHACAMFKVANYRMQITIDKSLLQTHSPEMEHVIYERIACAVDVHLRAIEYVKLLLSSMEKPFLFMIVMGVMSLSICLFRLFKTIMLFTDVSEVFITIALVFGHFCYIFFGNYLGQQITDCNAEIYNTVYSLPWYIAPVNIQKLLLFILQKGNKEIYLSAGSIFHGSYEGLTKLLTSSIYYLTVIYAVQ